MKIVFPSDGEDLGSSISGRFGRCRWFLLVDSDTKEIVKIENPVGEGGGAGVQASQIVIDARPDALVVRNLGPKAHTVLSHSDIDIYNAGDISIGEALEMLVSGELERIGSPNVSSHHGM